MEDESKIVIRYEGSVLARYNEGNTRLLFLDAPEGRNNDLGRAIVNHLMGDDDFAYYSTFVKEGKFKIIIEEID